MKRLATCLLTAGALALPMLASAHDYATGDLHIDHPWSRPTPPGVMMGAGYMVIRNEGHHDVTLVAAQSPRAGHVSIHQSRMEDGVMRMDAVDGGLVIPAGESVALKPHSYHLMLEQLDGQLTEGERIPLTLTFDGAPVLEVELAVDSLDGGTMDHSQMDHGNMDHDGMDSDQDAGAMQHHH
ncbi:copper chaperone PCu(A)C [Marinobacter xestospongiae]|uniref:Copper chaperone PCu(A)C n=1 Tax=Marinobacter xestospongiae TaxID=994319 RepID=A0ABU3VSL8_9GAMM|nr:copper chaperone PCu(A)C [Marinobacter xestospongiae]MDV2077264.1 copper chaperone PCu(A)C [Marinobacter xestospongiae]